MMPLPALDPAERAALRALSQNGALRSFALRLQQRLLASLGVAARVSEVTGGTAQDRPVADEPMIVIDQELAAAWLALRLGGMPGPASWTVRDEELIQPFKATVRRVLAESVVNTGAAEWPRYTRLKVAMGGRQGMVETIWNGAHAMAWARRTLRERA